MNNISNNGSTPTPIANDGRYMVTSSPNNGYVKISNDYGVTWIDSFITSIGAPYNGANCAAISSSGQIIYVSIGFGTNSKIYRSNDYGITWTLTNFPYIVNSGHGYKTISCDSTGQYVSAAINTGYYSGDYYLYQTSSDYGATVSGIMKKGNSSSESIYVTNLVAPITIYPQFAYESQSGLVYLPNSSTSRFISFSTPPTGAVNTIGMSFDNNYMLVSTDTALQYSTNSGSTWNVVSGLTYSTGNNCSSIDAFGRYMIVNTNTSLINRGKVYVSNNYGSTWTNVYSYSDTSGYSVKTAICATGKYMAITGAGSSNQLYISSDFGINWTNVSNTTGTSFITMNKKNS